MQITLVQGLLIALLVFICAIDKHMETFYVVPPAGRSVLHRHHPR